MKGHLGYRTACVLVVAVTAAVVIACGTNTATGPVPCDTYTGGILTGNTTAALPGTYALKSFCQGMKPDVAGATGTVSITATTFSASVTIQGSTTTYAGDYTTSTPDRITVNLTTPAPVQFLGTYRLRNDSLAVSGSAGGQNLSLVGTRTGP